MIDVNKLKTSLDMGEVIERYTSSAKSRGKYYCPFHNDKHPSLSVKGHQWKCWACSKGGDPINFVEELFGDSFVDACKRLSADWNIECGLYDINSDCSQQDQIAREVQKMRAEETAMMKELVASEITKLTDVCRILFHHGHYELAAKYSELLDELVDADLFTAYELLGWKGRETTHIKEMED